MELAAVTKLECKLRSTSRSSSAFLFLVIPERLRRCKAHGPTDSKAPATLLSAADSRHALTGPETQSKVSSRHKSRV